MTLTLLIANVHVQAREFAGETLVNPFLINHCRITECNDGRRLDEIVYTGLFQQYRYRYQAFSADQRFY